MMLNLSMGSKVMNKFIELENNHLKVVLSTFGAGIYQIYLKTDTLIPVLVTPSSPDDFIKNTNYYGVTIGRTSGRLFGPSYSMDKKTFPVTCNPNNPFMLHGGALGFWAQPFEVFTQESSVLVLKHISPPTTTFAGVLDIEVKYTLLDKTVRIEYKAHTTEDTLCNITNHAYFNLNLKNGTILDHILHLNSSKYIKLDEEYRFVSIDSVFDTPFDYKTPKRLGNGVLALKNTAQKGLDHCFIKDDSTFIGSLYEPLTNRRLSVFSDYPSVVIYTHNFQSKKPLNTLIDGGIYSSITFECQFEPDGIHHPGLNTAQLRKNEIYQHYIDFQFEF